VDNGTVASALNVVDQTMKALKSCIDIGVFLTQNHRRGLTVPKAQFWGPILELKE
jgi:hypothetical protein